MAKRLTGKRMKDSLSWRNEMPKALIAVKVGDSNDSRMTGKNGVMKPVIPPRSTHKTPIRYRYHNPN